jgi:tetraacyldisaccharide 4'-kinase
VTIISRGYGSKSGKPNDEYQEIAAQLPGVPHLQNPDRIAAAREALAREPRQVLILDDAFQHRRIARDFDLVLLDALDPFGAGRLLPRGLLREPVASLRRAHAVALSRADAVSPQRREEIHAEVTRLAPAALWLELEHRPATLVQHGEAPTRPIESLRGQKVAAFCGIGNPAGFRHTLAACGAQVIATREYPDHFAYPAAEVETLENWLNREAAEADAIVCTHKDLVKIPRQDLAGKPLFAVQIAAAIRVGEAALQEQLARLLQRVE